jgi:hypothetical protein
MLVRGAARPSWQHFVYPLFAAKHAENTGKVQLAIALTLMRHV